MAILHLAYKLSIAHAALFRKATSRHFTESPLLVVKETGASQAAASGINLRNPNNSNFSPSGVFKGTYSTECGPQKSPRLALLELWDHDGHSLDLRPAVRLGLLQSSRMTLQLASRTNSTSSSIKKPKSSPRCNLSCSLRPRTTEMVASTTRLSGFLGWTDRNRFALRFSSTRGDLATGHSV